MHLRTKIQGNKCNAFQNIIHQRKKIDCEKLSCYLCRHKKIAQKKCKQRKFENNTFDVRSNLISC